MTSQTGKQTIVTHILPNISISKGNETIKFDITWEIYFLKNYTQNVKEKLVPDLFLKKIEAAYLWTNSLKFYAVCFYCMPSWGLSKYIETKLTDHLHLHHVNLFYKTKRDLALVSLLLFLHDFWIKLFLLLYFINWPNFIVWLPLLCEIHVL